MSVPSAGPCAWDIAVSKTEPQSQPAQTVMPHLKQSMGLGINKPTILRDASFMLGVYYVCTIPIRFSSTYNNPMM